MNRTGFVLTFAMVSAILLAVMCVALMAMVGSEAQRVRFQRSRTQAVYASEAGMAWAHEKLVDDQCFSSGVGEDLSMVIDAKPYSVDVRIDPCAVCPPCSTPARKVQAKVTY